MFDLGKAESELNLICAYTKLLLNQSHHIGNIVNLSACCKSYVVYVYNM